MICNLIFFYTLIRFLLAEKSNYDLIEPMKATSPGEIGVWSLIGVATNMKKSIHFSPDSSRQNGAICNRIPTSSPEWYSQFRVQVSKGSLIYVISDESCPYWSISHSVNSWSGISLNITRKNNEKLVLIARYLNQSKPYEAKLCKVNSENVTIKASYINNTITFSVLADKDNYFTDCGYQIPISEKMSKNYFTFYAENSDGIGNSEIYHYILKIPSTFKESINLTESDDFNRHHILLQQEKRISEHPSLPLAREIIEEMEKANYKLSQGKQTNTTENIRDLLLEVKGRLKYSLTTDDLQKLIHATIAVNLIRAERKMEKRRAAFSNINEDLDNLKTVVDEKLKWLTKYVLDSMTEAQESAVGILNEFLEATKEGEELPKEAKRRAKEVKSAWTPTVLYLISFLEFVCYIVFFCVKRQKTHGFQKLD
ncbi:hypothetical protein M9Y10_002809 [Tritrichomonas musculus]|uniref:GOLD domain-containing protein n=1 Tax=Tritrichomonas musculus TaxID=1915356 RepID=A0ABR2LC71_9EUKA